jgi:hypothetical protein
MQDEVLMIKLALTVAGTSEKKTSFLQADILNILKTGDFIFLQFSCNLLLILTPVF